MPYRRLPRGHQQHGKLHTPHSTPLTSPLSVHEPSCGELDVEKRETNLTLEGRLGGEGRGWGAPESGGGIARECAAFRTSCVAKTPHPYDCCSSTVLHDLPLALCTGSPKSAVQEKTTRKICNRSLSSAPLNLTVCVSVVPACSRMNGTCMLQYDEADLLGRRRSSFFGSGQTSPPPSQPAQFSQSQSSQKHTYIIIVHSRPPDHVTSIHPPLSRPCPNACRPSCVSRTRKRKESSPPLWS